MNNTEKNNLVIETILKHCEIVNSLQGTITNAGTADVSVDVTVGSVYGIFIELSAKEFKKFKKVLESKPYIYKKRLENWKPINKSNFYPLYWGSSKMLGYRLQEHTRSSNQVYTIQLNSRAELKGKKLIYGTILCNDYKNKEKELRKNYPDVYKTAINKKEEI